VTGRPALLCGCQIFPLLACRCCLGGGRPSLAGCRCLASRRSTFPRLCCLLTGCELLGRRHLSPPHVSCVRTLAHGEILPSIGGLDRDRNRGSCCAYSSWDIAVTRPEIRGPTSPRIPIIAIQVDFCGTPGSMSNGARADTLTQPRCPLWVRKLTCEQVIELVR